MSLDEIPERIHGSAVVFEDNDAERMHVGDKPGHLLP